MPSITDIDLSELLVVGLGNPGPEYAGTRHNIGWACLEGLAQRLRADLGRKRWRSRVGCAEVDGRQLWLQEPQTFMNLSGRAVAEAARDLGLEPDSIWVVHDELDLPLGRLRIRMGGSAAGHNGIRSLINHLGTDGFVRFRVGVGKPPRPGSEAGRGYVLSRFTAREIDTVNQVVKEVGRALEMALREGPDRAMTVFNRPGSLGCEEIE
jgi:peptidyl-tRNA hydrolase, PTH1 family